jgi:2-(1,2-epoxy-1,2-dihydrophenyl)acetyl-CoA isomerase
VGPPELKTLKISGDGDIGTLTLDRPDAMNAMSPEMIFELSVAAAWLADRAPYRALVITGSGKGFSPGGDVNWFKKGLESPDEDLASGVRRGADVLHQAIVDFRRVPYPVIGAINGAAAGAGFSLALMCDIRIASEKAFFVVAYGRIGAAPDGGLTYFLPRVVGPAKAVEIALEDPVIDAEKALKLGIVNSVVPADELIGAANEKAAELAAKAPHYIRMVKSLLAQSLDNSLESHLQLERHGIADSMETGDLRRGVEAFLAGSEPEFRGD